MGAAYAYNASAHYNSDANYQAFLTLIDSVLDSAGLTQTADTGQFTGTETRPANSTAPHYQLREFGDGLVVKISIGCGTANTRPMMTFEVGTGSNGSGTITGVLAPANSHQGSATSQNWTSGGGTVYASGGADDTFTFVVIGDPDIPFAYGFQRRQDAQGNNVDDGQIALYGPLVPTVFTFDNGSQIGTTTDAKVIWPIHWPTSGTRRGSDVELYPAVLPWVDPTEYGLGDVFLAYRSGEIGANTAFEATAFPGKAPRGYIATGLSLGSGSGLLAIAFDA